MIVRTLNEVQGGVREVFASNGNWVSRRLLLKNDEMGFSLHDTIMYAGTTTEMCYRNHLEAVYCIEGTGEVETLDEPQRVYPITPGTVYALDQHDRHVVRAFTDLRIICVFNPPCVGNENHGPDGAYPVD